jgi:hypothetical protein
MAEQVTVKPDDYDVFVHEMLNDNWAREQIAVDQTNTNLAAVTALAAGATGTVIAITCPPGRVMSIMGTQQVPTASDRGTAHAFWMRLACGNIEINELIHINIQKTTPSTAVVPLIKDIYQSLCLVAQRNAGNVLPISLGSGNLYKSDDQIHRFRKGIVLYGQETLQIQAVNTNAAPTQQVLANNIQFSIDMDLWTRTV